MKQHLFYVALCLLLEIVTWRFFGNAQFSSASITVRQWTALRQGNLAGGGLADWRTDSAKSAAPAEWADWVHGPGVGPRWAEI